MKVNEYKEILESMEVGLFDKWMVKFEKVQDIHRSLDNYLYDPNSFVFFGGVGLYDDNDTQETKKYWWDLMDKYDEIIDRIDKQSMKNLLEKLNACEDAREWAGEKTIEEIVEQCYRGDWLLWLAKKVGIGLQPLTLAKGHCANTVRHLMKDEKSIRAVDTAIAFGEGKTSRQELDADAAFYAADADDADDAFYAFYAAAAAAFYAYAAADDDDADAARTQNQKETADICRQYIGQLIIDKCNKIQGGNK